MTALDRAGLLSAIDAELAPEVEDDVFPADVRALLHAAADSVRFLRDERSFVFGGQYALFSDQITGWVGRSWSDDTHSGQVSFTVDGHDGDRFVAASGGPTFPWRIEVLGLDVTYRVNNLSGAPPNFGLALGWSHKVHGSNVSATSEMIFSDALDGTMRTPTNNGIYNAEIDLSDREHRFIEAGDHLCFGVAAPAFTQGATRYWQSYGSQVRYRIAEAA